MLKLKDIHSSYGAVEALSGINLEIQKGEIVSLIGSNGAGKSTSLMTISGVLKPSAGRILLGDTDITHLPPHKIVSLGISQVPEGRRIFPKLTVLENLEMGHFLDRGDINASFEIVYSLFPILMARKTQMGGTLSGGEQQMLAIARALMCHPEILLLDEPSLGLAPIMVAKIFRTIQDINSRGVTVLLVEQNARAALRLSNRAYVLENGFITLQGRSADLLHNEQVRHAYLGE
jgi:branched-chain amino acid transport system ATP-binding protein